MAFAAGLKAQDSNLIQFTGLVLTADSINPIPFANIWIRNKGTGDYSNLEGYFSFVASKGDTIQFSHVEFETSYIVIPDTLSSYKYSIIKLMTRESDTFIIKKETGWWALPSRATFDHAFIVTEVPDDGLERARKNLDREVLKENAAKMGMDGSENFRNYMMQQAQRRYYAGQTPPINLLNPFAWAQFFEAWKRGDYKSKKKP
ncbi:MAG: carboxypeptidase-like regulatory domain-containing protein [Bacteroidia bacterium]|nr:carboxypeptidase-like regulatory domain-containing protein [Bacteroidia bacterium]